MQVSIAWQNRLLIVLRQTLVPLIVRVPPVLSQLLLKQQLPVSAAASFGCWGRDSNTHLLRPTQGRAAVCQVPLPLSYQRPLVALHPLQLLLGAHSAAWLDGGRPMGVQSRRQGALEGALRSLLENKRRTKTWRLFICAWLYGLRDDQCNLSGKDRALPHWPSVAPKVLILLLNDWYFIIPPGNGSWAEQQKWVKWQKCQIMIFPKIMILISL